MKIHILYKFVDGPWGGGNQFLKNLKYYFEQVGIYENNLEKADVILFNSHHCVKDVLRIKKQFPAKIIIHRLDGPIFLVRGNDLIVDKLIFETNELLADATVFQSNWCKNKCYEQGLKKTPYHDVIMNASDPKIFYPIENKFARDRKAKIIATSWSPNMRKGFDIYKYLDDNLDFNKYEMSFIGNSSIKFKNINYIEPLQSIQLAEELRKHDIYLTASINDPCSNALVEALSCGLPAVARNSGGHPEIVKGAGELFENENDVLSAIDKVYDNYNYYRNNIILPNIKEVGQLYCDLSYKIYNDIINGFYKPKQIGTFIENLFRFKIVKIQIHNYLKRFFIKVQK